ncbi:hypothetical protein NPIL_536651 [Nephila pilipes]|uniref:Uncharacterized protein n=1 Tax=Nephila pilipes TaxID=299642 RepID=A0A8X6TZY9_NEPPI|nr:hypothetical protein NPIL_536651 [Nephila pilipes]
MADAIALVLEVCIYLLFWIVSGSDSPSILEIVCYAIVVEFLKMCWLLEFPIGENLNGCCFDEFLENSVDDEVAVVSSFADLKVCQAPDLKVDLVPERKVISNCIHVSLKQSNGDMVPIVCLQLLSSFRFES